MLMGSHFHNWIDYNGVAFSIELLEWACTFLGVWDKKILASTDFGYLKMERFAGTKVLLFLSPDLVVTILSAHF